MAALSDEIKGAIDEAFAVGKARLRQAPKLKKRGRKNRIWLPPTSVQIKVFRNRLGLSQSQFCRRFGLDISSLRNWEQERAIPDQPTSMLLELIIEQPDVIAAFVAKRRELIALSEK